MASVRFSSSLFPLSSFRVDRVLLLAVGAGAAVSQLPFSMMGKAKADYDVSIAAADGDLAIAIEKCKMQPADAKTACEQTAHSVHDEIVKSAMSKLELANQQAS